MCVHFDPEICKNASSKILDQRSPSVTPTSQAPPGSPASASTRPAARRRKGAAGRLCTTQPTCRGWSTSRGQKLWSSSSRWTSWSGRTGWRCWRGSRSWWRRRGGWSGRRRRPSGWRRHTTKQSLRGWARTYRHLPPAAAMTRRKRLIWQDELF